MADTLFDNAARGTGTDTVVAPSGTTPTFQTQSSYRPMPVEAAQDAIAKYRGVPGGVVLEGDGPDLSDVQEVGYDARFNALVLDSHSIYVLKVSPKLFALMCRAIAGDARERVGVSAARPPIIYGAVPDDSVLAWDMLLADEFLGGIVFAEDKFTHGYNFADGYVPEKAAITYDVAVFFKFTDFNYQNVNGEWQPTGGSLDIQLVPLTDHVGPDGSFLPDIEAIKAGRMADAYAHNASHLAANIAYYRREAIVRRMFVYGQTAAFIRALKHADFNLTALADAIDPAAAG